MTDVKLLKEFLRNQRLEVVWTHTERMNKKKKLQEWLKNNYDKR